MTTNTEINPNGYAVVYFGDIRDTPRVCKGMSDGTRLDDGVTYAMYDTIEQAVEQFTYWPTDSCYGILPTSALIEEIQPPPRYRFKDSAR